MAFDKWFKFICLRCKSSTMRNPKLSDSKVSVCNDCDHTDNGLVFDIDKAVFKRYGFY